MVSARRFRAMLIFLRALVIGERLLEKGAGLPSFLSSQGQRVQQTRHVPRRSRNRAGFGVPDLPGILADRAIGGEPAAAGDIDDCPGSPSRGILAVERADALLGLNVTAQIGQVHVVISMRQERLVNRFVEAWPTGVDVVAEEQIEGGAGLGLVI